MNRTTLARRYAPLLAVAAVQLLIIATVPSKAPSQGRLASGLGTSGFASGPSTDGAPVGSTDASGQAAAGGNSGAPGTVAAGGPAGAAAQPGAKATPGQPGSAPAAAASGDTTHCVNGREFDPAIAYWAPPCVPGTPGAPAGDNGGNTATGVSKDSITIVDYVSNYGAEVNAILQAQGQLETYDNAVVLDKAYESFLNAKYVLYGRKIKIIPYAGQCTSVPPDKQCLIPEMDKLVDTYHPYMVFWNTTLCSECFAELARKKTIAIGGVGFSEQFAAANAPYYYAAGGSSSRIETEFAQFWCNQLQGGQVKYAGTGNPTQNFNGKPRVLGIISTNDPDNEDTVKNVLVPQLAQCGQNVTHFYYYDQNINTAAQQVQAGIAAMDTPSNPATDVLCLCDSVAPAFVYEGEQQNNYYPENLLADVQGMGYDNTGQSYEQNSDGSASLGCPTPPNCEYDNAFGILSDGPQEPQDNDEGVRMYHLGGGQGAPPVTGLTATSLAVQWGMMADLIENTGPNLNPVTMHDRAPALGTVGGGATGHALLGFVPKQGINGDINYNWALDARVVYWNKHTKSSYNQAPGSYIQIEGNRFDLGQFPKLPDGPPIPATRS